MTISQFTIHFIGALEAIKFFKLTLKVLLGEIREIHSNVFVVNNNHHHV